MTLYHVTWEIDVEADNPKQAARKARAAQVRRGTIAKVFDVFESIYEPAEPGGPSIRVATVDLAYPEETVMYPDGSMTRGSQ